MSASPTFSHPLAVSFSDNYKKPVHGQFDDLTKDILKIGRKNVIETKVAWHAEEMKLSAFMDAVFVSSNTFFLAACLLTKHNLFLSQLFEKLFINVQCRLKLGVQTRNKLLSSSKLECKL